MGVDHGSDAQEIDRLQRQVRNLNKAYPNGSTADSQHPGAGDFSVQIGDAALGNGDYSVAIGQAAETGAAYTTSLGPGTYTGDVSAVAVGYGATATGSASVAIGQGSNVSHHQDGVAIGRSAMTNDDHEFVLGNMFHKVKIPGRFGVAQRTPTGTADTQGDVGDIAVDDNYVYVNTSAGWKRAGLSTF